MAYTFDKYTGDGETVRFTVSFPFINREHVKVKIQDEKVPFDFVDDDKIELRQPAADGDTVLIYRQTNPYSKIVNFQHGSILRTEDLNIDSLQNFYCLQEFLEAALKEDIDWSEAILENIVEDTVDAEITTDYLLGKLTDSITQSQLYQDIRDPLNKVDPLEEDVVKLESDMSLTKSQWTVKIDSNGHVVGTGLILYPDYDPDKDYKEGDIVWHEDTESVYQCIQDHSDEEPPNEDYWEKLDNEARSEFMIVADRFAIIDPDSPSDDPKVPFVVSTIDGDQTVGVDGHLIVDDSIAAKSIMADAITSEKITADAITSDHIAAGAISAEHVVVGDIDALELLNGPDQPNADVTRDNTSSDTTPTALKFIFQNQEEWETGELTDNLKTAGGELELSFD